MNNRENGISKGATPNPGDFALGSPESRAAARAMLVAKTSLSEDDLDCLNIVHVCQFSSAQYSPNYADIEATAAWQRGWAISQERNPIIPSHLDPMYGKRGLACFEFEKLHDRLPGIGECFTFSELVEAFNPADYEVLYNDILAESWRRKLPQLPYPLRWENGRLYGRICDHRTGEVRWTLHTTQHHPEHCWKFVEYELMGEGGLFREPSETAMPIHPEVVFSINASGEYIASPRQS